MNRKLRTMGKTQQHNIARNLAHTHIQSVTNLRCKLELIESASEDEFVQSQFEPIYYKLQSLKLISESYLTKIQFLTNLQQNERINIQKLIQNCYDIKTVYFK